MKSRCDLGFILGTAAMAASAFALLNCSRTPKFRDNNPGAPNQPQQQPPPTNPGATSPNSLSTPSVNVLPPPDTRSRGVDAAAQAAQAKLVGTWVSNCVSPDAYESGIAALAQAKNIEVTYSFGTDLSYFKSISIFADTDNTCSAAATSTPINETGTYSVGPSIVIGPLKGGTAIALSVPGSAKEFNVFKIDPNLEMGPAGNTDQGHLPEGFSTTISYRPSGS